MRAKKSLGQHFLKSKPALAKIISAGEVSRDDIILEIGPGKGVLTQELLKDAGKVVAVEKDKNLFDFLQKKFTGEIKSGKLVLINGDILKFTSSSSPEGGGKNLSPLSFGEGRGEVRYKIIANIPYNITGAILKKFLTDEIQPERIVLLVQHEVAQRIIARDPRHGGAGAKESILSISVKAYGEPEMIGKVPARYFSPQPKVDSAIIVIKNISRRIFKENEVNEERFWEIVKKGFAHKRKKLSGNLKNAVSGKILALFADKRAEDLTLEDWIYLASP